MSSLIYVSARENVRFKSYGIALIPGTSTIVSGIILVTRQCPSHYYSKSRLLFWASCQDLPQVDLYSGFRRNGP